MRIRDLLDPRAVELTYAPVSKEDAISHIVDKLATTGCLDDAERFKLAVLDRERKGSTGLGEGIAIPHAKSAGCARPGLAAMVVKEGVAFESIDGQPVHLIFLIASPHQASDAHLDVLARLSSLLIDEQFRKELMNASSVEEFLACVDAAERREIAKEAAEAAQEASVSADSAAVQEETSAKEESPAYEIVAVTACPAGLSHTYMAAEALERKAHEMGISIKVEADGAAGNRNRLLPEEIAKAKAVIVAADRAVDIDRFMGKPMVRTGVVDGVKKPGELIKQALDPDCPVFTGGSSVTETSHLPMKMYRHLMSGLTYILPLAATAGILSAIARLWFVEGSSLGLFLESIGYSIGTLLFPVLSAFIAFSMAGRMALVAGFTGGVMADMLNAGVIGAVLNGFVGGAVAFLVARLATRFLKGHDAMFALLVYPLVGATLTTLIAQFVTGVPAMLLDTQINTYLAEARLWELALIGALLAGMMSADMGGPFNKISYAVGVLLLADCLPENGPGSQVMGAVMLGGMVPPLAAGVAALFARRHFTESEHKGAFKAIVKGLLFITEGVIPYLAAAPKRMRFSCITGSAVAGAISLGLGAGLCAPHGGIFIISLAQKPWVICIALLAGTLVGALCFTFLRPQCKAKAVPEPSAESAAEKQGEAEAEKHAKQESVAQAGDTEAAPKSEETVPAADATTATAESERTPAPEVKGKKHLTPQVNA